MKHIPNTGAQATRAAQAAPLRGMPGGMSVAIIGPDGAGKSTLVARLQASPRLFTQVVYMGGNAASANHVLPTTRWLTNRWLAQQDQAHTPGEARTVERKARTRPNLAGQLLGGLKQVVKLAHEVLEYSYRFIVARSARRQGAVVLYDRYVYDPLIDAMADNPSRFEQFRARLFKTIFPRPDLLIVLEAPGRLLFERKGEHSPERLDRVRAACRQIAAGFRHVEYIDATLPSDVVAERALAFILKHSAPSTEPTRVRRLSRVG